MSLHPRGAFSAALLASTFLSGLAGFLLLESQSAWADCQPGNVSANGATVLCTGPDTDGLFVNGFTNTTVNIQDGAILSQVPGGTPAIMNNTSNSAINAFGNSQIVGTGVSGLGIDIDGPQNTVTLNDSSRVSADGLNAVGALLSGNSNTITLNDRSSITTAGNNAFGIFASGNDERVTLNGSSNISTAGIGASGVFITGNTGVFTFNDNATINTLGGGANGVQVTGNSNTITVDGTASISTISNSSAGININGNNNTVTLDGNAAISTAGVSSRGILVSGSNTVIVNDGATVSTSNDSANAIELLSGSNTLINHGKVSSTSTLANAVSGNNAGNDTIINTGVLFSRSGTSISLQGGNDSVTLGTGSDITGIIDGGAGVDGLTLTGSGSEDDLFSNFETLTMDGGDWSLSANSSFGTFINVVHGRLGINGIISSAGGTQVDAAGILGGSGRLNSNVINFGTIAPGNSVGTLNIVGTLTQAGGGFEVEFDRSGIDRTNVSGTVTLSDFPQVEVKGLNGAGGANGVFLHSDAAILGTIGKAEFAGNGAATLIQGATDLSLIAVDGSQIVAGNFAALQTGLDYLDTVNRAQLDQNARCMGNECRIDGTKRLWARGFGRFGSEGAEDGNQAFDYRNAGAALGGDIEVLDGFTIGGSLGYANTRSEVVHDDAESEADGEFAALYATFEIGDFFITGTASGGLQQFDLERKVATASDTEAATAETDGLLFGGSLQAGLHLDFPQGWRLTPMAGVSYQHQSVEGYREQGAGDGAVEIGDQDSDAIRANAQINLARTIAYDSFDLVPHIRAGIAGQFNFGDDVAGAFSNGADFTLAQQEGSRAIGLAGAGMDISFENGVTLNVDYDGQFSGDGEEHAVIVGAAFKW